MAKVTHINQHDWLAVRVTFSDGTKADVTWSRNGEKVDVTPFHAANAEALSIIVMKSKSSLRKPGYPFANLGDVADAMENCARTSDNLETYIQALQTALAVTAERPLPRAAATAPAKTLVELRQSRGWQVKVTFPTGERADMKINLRSVSLLLDPHILSKYTEIMDFVFGVKQTGLLDDRQLAETVVEAARNSGDLDGWIAGMKAMITPAGPRR